MLENGKAAVESAVVDTADLFVPARMRRDLARAEHFVEVWVTFEQMRGGGKAVNKRRFAAGAVGVGEHVEHLEAAGVGKVGCVGVDGEGQGRVCSVCRVDRGSEVPESTIVGWPDESNPVEKSFGGRRSGRTVCREGEAKAALFIRRYGVRSTMEVQVVDGEIEMANVQSDESIFLHQLRSP